MRISLILRKCSPYSWNVLHLMKFFCTKGCVKGGQAASYSPVPLSGAPRDLWRPSHSDWARSPLGAGKGWADFRTAGAASFPAGFAEWGFCRGNLQLLLPPGPEHTRCHGLNGDAFLQRHSRSHQAKADPKLLQKSTGITESGAASLGKSSSTVCERFLQAFQMLVTAARVFPPPTLCMTFISYRWNFWMV